MERRHSLAPVIITGALAAVMWFFGFYVEWGNFWIKLGLSAATLAAIALVLGPRPEKPEFLIKDIAIGLGSAAVLYLVFLAGFYISRFLFDFAPGQVGGIYARGEGTPGWLILLILLLVTGPAEEIFWRGFFQRRLQERFGGLAGFIIASAVYTFIHLSAWNFMLIGAAAVAGIFWGLLYWRLGRLFPVIVSHSVWSAVIFAVFPVR